MKRLLDTEPLSRVLARTDKAMLNREDVKRLEAAVTAIKLAAVQAHEMLNAIIHRLERPKTPKAETQQGGNKQCEN